MAQRTINDYNRTTLKDLEPGDLVEFDRGIYSHWAVYIGQHETTEHAVVHLAGIDEGPLRSASTHSFTICGKQFDKAQVCVHDFWKVAGDCKAHKNNGMDKAMSPDERSNIVARALSMLGPATYNLITKNCEHFASWCRYGIEKSEQAEGFIGAAVLGLLSLIDVAFKYIFRRRNAN